MCHAKGSGLYAEDAGKQAGILSRQRTQGGHPGGRVEG